MKQTRSIQFNDQSRKIRSAPPQIFWKRLSKMLTAARPVAARFLLPQSSVNRAIVKPTAFLRTMGTIADGVEFDTIAREWRCKVREMKQINVTFSGPNLPLGSEQIMRPADSIVYRKIALVGHGYD